MPADQRPRLNQEADASILARLAGLGLELPVPARPVANYVPVTRAGDLLFTSGQLPLADGRLIARGIVGHDVTPDTARRCAQQCAVNALAAIRSEIGSLAAIVGIVKMLVAVASAPSFIDQSAVGNGASDLLDAAFGERGRHSRTVLGVASLPMGAPVELDVIVRVSAAASPPR